MLLKWNLHYLIHIWKSAAMKFFKYVFERNKANTVYFVHLNLKTDFKSEMPFRNSIIFCDVTQRTANPLLANVAA